VLKDRVDAEVELRPGKVGQFDVVAEGKLVFSKAEAGRFPDPDEVLRALPAD
jgi:selT/selW/selH-like putative selenoprotein